MGNMNVSPPSDISIVSRGVCTSSFRSVARLADLERWKADLRRSNLGVRSSFVASFGLVTELHGTGSASFPTSFVVLLTFCDLDRFRKDILRANQRPTNSKMMCYAKSKSTVEQLSIRTVFLVRGVEFDPIASSSAHSCGRCRHE